MFSGHGQQWQLPMPPLNDPVLDAIKRHLAISWRIGFEPISGRFARLAFYIKKRMELKLNSYHHFCQDPHKDYAEVVLKRKNGPNECPAGVILLSDMKTALHSLFRRVRKWRSVDFALFGDIVYLDSRDLYLVPDDNPVGEYGCDCPLFGEPLVEHLLDAISAESHLTSRMHLRRFECNGVSELNLSRLTAVLQRVSPHLRQLSIGLKFDDWSQESFPPDFLIEAIGACQQLRLLAIGVHFPLERMPPSLHAMLLALPQLTGLRLGQYLWPSMTTDPHSLSLADAWLPVGAQLAAICHQHSTIAATGTPPLLHRMQCLKLEMGIHGIDREPFFSNAPKIIAEMRRPTRIIIESLFDIDWASIWRDCLPLVHSTGATIHVHGGLYRGSGRLCTTYTGCGGGLCTGRGLDVITAQEFAAGVATLPAYVQASLIPPDLNTALVEHNHYSELKFRFHNGGELSVQRRNLQN